MHISLLFRVQTLSDVTTNINALYVMTVKAITDFFFFFFLATTPGKQHIGFLHSVCSSGTDLHLCPKGNGT